MNDTSDQSDSSDDEEYLPPDESVTSSSESEIEDAEKIKNTDVYKEDDFSNPNELSHRDAIWDAFLSDKNTNKAEVSKNGTVNNLEETTTKNFVKPLSSSSLSANKETISSPQKSCAFTPSYPGCKRPISAGPADRISDVLKKLKSVSKSETGPKLSTLEKSRLDWNTFTENEGITDDLKLHNKGKLGYVERKAFESRTNERQYLIEQQARLKGSQRR